MSIDESVREHEDRFESADSFASPADDADAFAPEHRRAAAPIVCHSPIDPEEIEALLVYVVRRGLDADGAAVRAASAAIDDFRSTQPPTPEARDRLLDCYLALCRLVDVPGVNGHTIRQSLKAGRKMAPMLAFGLAVMVGVMGIEVLLVQPVLEIDGPELGRRLAAALGVQGDAIAAYASALESDPLLRERLRALVGMHTERWTFWIVPALWGALGACVYLLKTILDRASAMRFDGARMRGLGARVFLGALFGALLVNAFQLQIGEVTTAGVAFLGGLGVRAVYAAFEALVDGVHDRISPTRAGHRPGSALLPDRE